MLQKGETVTYTQLCRPLLTANTSVDVTLYMKPNRRSVEQFLTV